MIAGVVGFLVFRSSFNSGSKTAQCEKCSAAFSRSKTDTAETVLSSENKEEREEQEDRSTKVTTWVEDKVQVVDSYTCAKCGDVTTKTYETTRRRDEAKVIEPFVDAKGSAQVAEPGAGKKSGSAPSDDGKGRKS